MARQVQTAAPPQLLLHLGNIKLLPELLLVQLLHFGFETPSLLSDPLILKLPLL